MHAVAVPSTHVHYDQHARAEVPRRRRTLRIVLIVVAVVVVLWLIGQLISYTLFNAGGTVPGTGTGEIIGTP
jgi:ferric-dicitrate binding protein FerR (iron transport regulator)